MHSWSAAWVSRGEAQRFTGYPGYKCSFRTNGSQQRVRSPCTYLGLELLVQGIQEVWVHKEMRFIQIHYDAWHLLIDGQDELLDSCVALGGISTASHG